MILHDTLILCEDSRVDERTENPPWQAGFLFVAHLIKFSLDALKAIMESI